MASLDGFGECGDYLWDFLLEDFGYLFWREGQRERSGRTCHPNTWGNSSEQLVEFDPVGSSRQWIYGFANGEQWLTRP